MVDWNSSVLQAAAPGLGGLDVVVVIHDAGADAAGARRSQDVTRLELRHPLFEWDVDLPGEKKNGRLRAKAVCTL